MRPPASRRPHPGRLREGRRSMRLGANQIIAIVLAVFAVGYLIMAFQIRVFPLPRPIDSDLFPKVLGLLLFGLSVILFLEAPQEPEEERMRRLRRARRARLPSPPVGGGRGHRRCGGRLRAAPAAAGLPAVSVLLVAGLTWCYGYRNHLLNLAVAVLVPVVFYLLLTRGLGINLPRGVVPF
jgi:putative tricarboxylic transport membrane protein